MVDQYNILTVRFDDGCVCALSGEKHDAGWSIQVEGTLRLQCPHGCVIELGDVTAPVGSVFGGHGVATDGVTLRNHPYMENNLRLDAEHVIIDREVYFSLIKRLEAEREFKLSLLAEQHHGEMI